MIDHLVALAILAAAVVAIARQWEVRLVLLTAAMLLGVWHGQPQTILKTFFSTFTAEKFVVPICCSMGFAQVLKATQCDQHLVRLLTNPLRRVVLFVVPGAVLVAFIVNIPIISQTSTALAVGSVLVPLLFSAGLPAKTVGATLLLGASMGGELLNPGAPELNTIASFLKIGSKVCVATLLPLLAVSCTAAVALFWFLSFRSSRAGGASPPSETATPPTPSPVSLEPVEPVSFLKAFVPLVPLLLLFLTGPPLNLVTIPKEWLVALPKDADYYDARLIGLAMLVGSVLAALTDLRRGGQTAVQFFEGAGYAFTHIISLIVVAQCFGKAIELSGLAEVLGAWASHHPALLLPLAAFIPLGFAALSGSGMAATQSLYAFFVPPAQTLGIDPIQIGALVSIGAAAGRTMSPVSAVNLMCAKLTETKPLDLSRRVAPPLLFGVLVLVIVAQLWLVPAKTPGAVP